MYPHPGGGRCRGSRSRPGSPGGCGCGHLDHPARRYRPGAVDSGRSTQFTIIDTKTGVHVGCPSSTASGTLKSGSGLPGFHAGSLTAVAIGLCVGAGGPKFTLQGAGLPWHVNFFSYNAAKAMARGTISHTHITVGGSGCDAMIDGTGATNHDGRVTFRYTDSAGHLRVQTAGGNLHFYDVSAGCLGIFNDGDPAALSVTYTVSPEQAITSP